eukprot:scaffold977_cov253-Pinguiococcus_pyrenoidosus.AAC.1
MPSVVFRKGETQRPTLNPQRSSRVSSTSPRPRDALFPWPTRKSRPSIKEGSTASRGKLLRTPTPRLHSVASALRPRRPARCPASVKLPSRQACRSKENSTTFSASTDGQARLASSTARSQRMAEAL